MIPKISCSHGVKMFFVFSPKTCGLHPNHYFFTEYKTVNLNKIKISCVFCFCLIHSVGDEQTLTLSYGNNDCSIRSSGFFLCECFSDVLKVLNVFLRVPLSSDICDSLSILRD